MPVFIHANVFYLGFFKSKNYILPVFTFVVFFGLVQKKTKKGTGGEGRHFGVGAAWLVGGQRALPGVPRRRSEVSEGRWRVHPSGVHVVRRAHVKP